MEEAKYKCDDIKEIDETIEDIVEGTYSESKRADGKRKYAIKLSPAVYVTDWRFMEFSERRNKIPHKSWEYRKKLRPIISKIWEVAGKELIERDAGVFLDRLGYFCNWMSPTKRVIYKPYFTISEDGKTSMEMVPNFLLFTGGYWYFPTFFSDVFHTNIFYNWAMDSTLAYPLRCELVKSLKRGKKYVFHYEMLKTNHSTFKKL